MNEPQSFGAVTPDEFRRIREVFESALEHSPADRVDFVERACGGNAVLIAEVERMLAADATRSPLLDAGALPPTESTADRFTAGAVFATSFHIIAPLGRGGMGEVYRAHDVELNRHVALKILPEAFAYNLDRLARFKREAQLLASLNHPNIGAIYGFEESSPSADSGQAAVQALVLELVEGPTLADRIAQGVIPLDEAVPIARQIAEALEAAHEQGIVHRDLKPANIKLRPDGTVKVLDFGLAKALRPESVAGDVASPTITSSSLAQRGVIIGTAAYVSPEQARGYQADKRSDVWAFGAVLYEMLSGRRLFKGDDASETLASVLRQDIDWTALQPSTPASVRHLISRCLERDVRRRLRDIGEARIALEEGPAPQTMAGMRSTVWRRAIPIAVTAIVTGALAGTAWYLRPSIPREVTRLSFTLPEGQSLSSGDRSIAAISPDGTQIVYVAAPSALYLRSLLALEPNVIRGTEGNGILGEPVFSPDGRSIVFHASADQTLKRIPVTGGATVTLCRADFPHGLSWGPDGILFVQPGTGIMRVYDDGGTPEVLVNLDEGEAAQSPQTLPGGQHLLFTLANGLAPNRWDSARIVVQSLASGERKTLIDGGSDARYVPTGHLVYAVGGSVFAVAFDVTRLQVSGGAVSVVDGVRRGAPSLAGTAQFGFASNGSLMYIAGPPSARWDLGLTDRKGGVEPLKLPPGPYEAPRVSPDGTRIAFGTDDGKEAIVWIYDLAGATTMRRLTFGRNNRLPTWSSDGTRVAFQSDRDGDAAIFWQPVDGGPAERLTTPSLGESHEPEAWSPNGEMLLFSITNGSDVSLSTLALKQRRVTPFGEVRSSTRTGAVFSPDGQWVAYASFDGSGRTIYVEPYPATGVKHQLVPKGAGEPHQPLWSPDGRQLFYNPGPGRFESVTVTTHPVFAFGNPVAVPRPFPGASPLTRRPYDITPDGRFLSAIAAGQSESGRLTAPQIQVVLNWFEELRARVPTTN